MKRITVALGALSGFRPTIKVFWSALDTSRVFSTHRSVLLVGLDRDSVPPQPPQPTGERPSLSLGRGNVTQFRGE